MAPAYANLFMGKLEKHLISLANNHIKTWKRYIDDIFIIWTGTTNKFEDYRPIPQSNSHTKSVTPN